MFSIEINLLLLDLWLSLNTTECICILIYASKIQKDLLQKQKHYSLYGYKGFFFGKRRRWYQSENLPSGQKILKQRGLYLDFRILLVLNGKAVKVLLELLHLRIIQHYSTYKPPIPLSFIWTVKIMFYLCLWFLFYCLTGFYFYVWTLCVLIIRNT